MKDIMCLLMHLECLPLKRTVTLISPLYLCLFVDFVLVIVKFVRQWFQLKAVLVSEFGVSINLTGSSTLPTSIPRLSVC